MLGTTWSAVRAALVAAIFTFLAQLLKGLLEYRTAAAARTSMRRMIFKKVLELDAGGDFAFGCLFMPASAEQRVPWKNRGAQKRLINRKINKYMKINFTSFLVTEGLIYAAIVAALVGLSGCGKSTILPAASSVLCANGGRDPHQWNSTGKNQFPGASSAHYFSGAAPSPAVTGS